MALKRRVATAPALHSGVDRYGSAVLSSEVIDNQATSFLRFLIREIRAKYLSPSDVVTLIGGQDEKLHALFSLTTISDWAMLDRFWLWPLAHSARPSEEALRCFGEGRPVWLSDENRWTKMCNEAERWYGHPSRFATPRFDLQEAIHSMVAR